MTPFLVLSGKSIDDLGFPTSCQADQHNYTYSTVQVVIDTQQVQYTGYLGFCFPSMCSVEDLNSFGQFMIDFIFAEYPHGVKGNFVKPTLQQQFSLIALLTCLFFVIIITITMYKPISQWINLCRSQQQSQYSHKSIYIDLQNPDNQLDQDSITYNSGIMQRVSIKYKWKMLWRNQQSDKIYSFSLFRILAIPLLIYGQIFWLTNFGSYNYYAFYQQIYDQFYVKIAIFSYYMPDIFYFISAFLLTKKVIQQRDQQFKTVIKLILFRLVRLYPLYIVAFIIYWCITPYLHSGPIWYVYQQQAAVCNHSWWRVLLMIDNWWTQGCYPALWFVQLQIQFTILFSLIFFSVYLKNKKIAMYLLYIYIIIGLVLLFVFSEQFLVSVKIAISPATQLYFKSFYSHVFFYSMGILFALFANNQNIRVAMQTAILDHRVFRYAVNMISISILILILFRPWIWWSSEKSLQMQLAVCRLGTLICFILLFLRGMFVKQKYSTVIHKYGHYMYPVLLVSFFIVSSSFWSMGSFMYLSGFDIINLVVPNFIISYTLGIFLGLLFDHRPFMIG